MTISALVFWISTVAVYTGFCGYFFYRIVTTKKKEESDSSSEKD